MVFSVFYACLSQARVRSVRVFNACLLVILLAAFPSGPVGACAFHLFTDLPEAPLSQ